MTKPPSNPKSPPPAAVTPNPRNPNGSQVQGQRQGQVVAPPVAPPITPAATIVDERDPMTVDFDAAPDPKIKPQEDRELTLHEINQISKQAEEQARKARYENKTEAELIILRAEDEAKKIIMVARDRANAEYATIVNNAQAEAARIIATARTKK